MKPGALFSAKFTLVFLLCIAMVSCATAPAIPAAPATTRDMATMVADSVSTINANWTAQALLNPSTTPTLAPSATATFVTPTVTPLPPTLTPTVSLMPTPTRPEMAAELLKVWTYPSSKTEYRGNEGFGIAIYLKNTGSAAWEPGYQLKLMDHTGPGEITVQTLEILAVTVAPGGTVEFDLWGFGSEHPGKHTYTFMLFTSYGFPIPGSEVSYSFTSIL